MFLAIEKFCFSATTRAGCFSPEKHLLFCDHKSRFFLLPYIELVTFDDHQCKINCVIFLEELESDKYDPAWSLSATLEFVLCTWFQFHKIKIQCQVGRKCNVM